MRIGQGDNEPRCLAEGIRRVVEGEVQLHFHRVIARPAKSPIPRSSVA